MLPGQLFGQDLVLGCFRTGIGLKNGYSEKRWFGAQLLVYCIERRSKGRTLVQHTAGVRGRGVLGESGKGKRNADHVQDVKFRWHQAILQLTKWLLVVADELKCSNVIVTGSGCAIYDGVRGNCCRNMCRNVCRSAFVCKVAEQWQKHGNNYVAA